MTPDIKPAIPNKAKFFSGKPSDITGANAYPLQKWAKTKPVIHPKKRLGAKVPPHPPPPLVALVAKTLKSTTNER